MQAEYNRILDLRTLLRVLRVNFAIVTAFAVVLSMLVSLIVFRMPSTYRSTAVLLIEQGHEQGMGLEALFAQGAFSQEYFETQRELLMSHALALRVATRNDLHELGEFRVPAKLDWWQGDLRRHLPGLPTADEQPAAVTQEQRVSYAVEVLRQALSVAAVPRTKLVKISVELRDPVLAQSVASWVAAAYVESGLETRLAKTQTANAWFSSRLTELKDSLAQAESKLQSFLDENKLVDVGGIRGLLEKDIQDNSTSLLEARKTVARLQAVVEEIRRTRRSGALLENIQALNGDQAVRSTRERYLAAKQKDQTISKRYGTRHPARQESATELRAALESYERQLQAAADALETEYEFARREVRDLSRFAEKNKADLQALARKSYELRGLEREVALNRQMYDLFLEKVKQTDLSEDFESVNAVIVDPPRAPKAPSEPRRKMLIAAAFLLSYLLGYALILLRWSLNDQIDSPDELLDITMDVPLLGSVPKIKALFGSMSPRKLQRAIATNTTLMESVQSLRTGLLLSSPDNDHKQIMVTSSIPGEGKSLMSLALGHSFARLSRTLVIEADLRKPRLGKAAGLDKQAEGLVQYMLEDRPLKEFVHPLLEDSLYLLPAGSLPPNPLELLSSRKFQHLLDDAAADFDRIIIDTPPVEVVSDALSIAPKVDLTVLVVAAGKTDAKLVLHTLNQLNRAKAKLAGTVLNQVDVKRLARHYGGRYAGYAAADYYRA